MAKNPTPSHQDINQYSAREHDTDNDAKRVVIVGGEGITLNADIKMPQILETQVIIKEVQVLEVPVIVKEFEKIEVPVVVKEIEYRTIEIPITIKEIQVVTVDKPVINTIYEKIEVPVIVRELVKEEFPLSLKVFLGVQVLCSLLQIVASHIK